MMRTLVRYWVGMLAMMTFVAVFAAPTWAFTTVIDDITDNLWVGFAILFVWISLQAAILMTCFSTPRGRRLIDRLARIVFEHSKAA